MDAQIAELLFCLLRAVFEAICTCNRGFAPGFGTLGPSPFHSQFVGHGTTYDPTRTASIAAVQRSSRVESLTVAST